MSRRDAGRYRTKHPPGTEVEPTVIQAVASKLDHQKIACHTAFEIATQLSVPPSTVGVAIDLQEGRIVECQLGLFGYQRRRTLSHGSAQVDEHLKSTLLSTALQGRLPCAKAWQVASILNVPRLTVAQACDILGIRISQCQLGAFD